MAATPSHPQLHPRIKIAIVGLRFGSHIARTLLAEPQSNWIELAAVCDQDRDLGQRIASELAVPFVASLDQVLADPRFDAVGLYTPPGGRSDLIRRAIRAGKHVMTTKPFDLDPAAAELVLQEAQQLGRVVHLNSPSPLLPPDLLQIRTWSKQYDLGRIIGCRASVYARYRETADGSWYDDPLRCPVAPIFRLGIYVINDLVGLMGDAAKVTTLSSRIFTGRPTPDNAQLSILFKTGAIGAVFASFCVDDGQQYANTLVANYERGTIYRNIGPLAYGDVAGKSHISVVALKGEKQTVIQKVTLSGASGEYQWDVFAKAIRGERSPEEITPGQIVAGLKIIAAMAKADREQTTVSV